MTIQWPVLLFLALVLPTVAALIAYYMLLRYRGQPTNAFREEIRLWIPIIVALFAAVLGYTATREATSVAERTVARDSLLEVRNVAEAAVRRYTAFLFSVQRAFTAATALEVSVEDVAQWRRIVSNPTPANLSEFFEIPAESLTEDVTEAPVDTLHRILDVMESALTRAANSVADRLIEMDEALDGINAGTLARTCYRDKWLMLGSDLRIGAIGNEHEDEQIRVMASDYALVSQLLHVGVERIRSTPEVTERPRFTESYNRAVAATSGLSGPNGEEPIGAYRTLVFLGSLMGDLDESLLGAAALGDLLSAVPSREEFSECLTNHFRDNPALVEASHRYDVRFDPFSISPSLYSWLNEMEDRGLEYVIQNNGSRSDVVSRVTGEALAEIFLSGADTDLNDAESITLGGPSAVRIDEDELHIFRLEVAPGLYTLEARAADPNLDLILLLWRDLGDESLGYLSYSDDDGVGYNPRLEENLEVRHVVTVVSGQHLECIHNVGEFLDHRHSEGLQLAAVVRLGVHGSGQDGSEGFVVLSRQRRNTGGVHEIQSRIPSEMQPHNSPA